MTASSNALRSDPSEAQGPERPDLPLYEMRAVHREDFARQVLDSDAQVGCGRQRVPVQTPRLYRSERGDHYAFGLKRCGSVWACPVCADRICRSRGAEVRRAIEAHHDQGGRVDMLTVTIPHHRGHSLAELYEALMLSWQYLKGGSPWQTWADRIGYVGAVRGVDATTGGNGWHPHIHGLLFLSRSWEESAEALGRSEVVRLADDLEVDLDPSLSIGELLRECFLAWVRDRWARKIESWYLKGDHTRNPGELAAWPLNRRRPDVFHPRFGTPHPEHGARLTAAHRAGTYVAKMGLGREVNGVTIKGGRGEDSRTPMQVLADYTAHRDPDDADLWREWIEAMHGKQHLVWSPGLRGRLGLEEDQPHLEKQAEEDPGEGDELILEIEPMLWDALQALAEGRLAEKLIAVLDAGGGLEAVVDLCTRVFDSHPTAQGEVRLDRNRSFLWIG